MVKVDAERVDPRIIELHLLAEEQRPPWSQRGARASQQRETILNRDKLERKIEHDQRRAAQLNLSEVALERPQRPLVISGSPGDLVR